MRYTARNSSHGLRRRGCMPAADLHCVFGYDWFWASHRSLFQAEEQHEYFHQPAALGGVWRVARGFLRGGFIGGAAHGRAGAGAADCGYGFAERGKPGLKQIRNYLGCAEQRHGQPIQSPLGGRPPRLHDVGQCGRRAELLKADTYYDVQVGADVSGSTVWSPRVGGVADMAGVIPDATRRASGIDSVILSWSLTFSNGQIHMPNLLVREPALAVSPDITTVAATATTLGRGKFGFRNIATGNPDSGVASGATTQLGLSSGATPLYFGVLRFDGHYGDLPYIVTITRKALSTATSAPAQENLDGFESSGGVLRASMGTANLVANVDSYRITWRTSDPDGGNPETAGKWQDAAGEHVGIIGFFGATYNIPGVSLDTTYDVRVRAVNGIGAGLWSRIGMERHVVVTAPSVPQNLSATTSGRNILITWVPPSELGSADITNYHLRWRLTDADGAGPGTAAGPWQDSMGDDAECNDSDAANDDECGISTISNGYTIMGLDTVSHDIAIAASNSGGMSPWTGDTDTQATPVLSIDAALSLLRIFTGENPLSLQLDPALFQPTVLTYTAAAGQCSVMPLRSILLHAISVISLLSCWISALGNVPGGPMGPCTPGLPGST